MAESEEDRHLKLTGEFDCDPTPLSTLRHSTSHVMAQAVKRLFPDVKVAIGPAIEDGFYYDFAKAEPFAPEDLARIEAVMHDIVKADLPFERREMPRGEAIAFFRERGERFKVEILEGIPADRVSLYTQGDFIDLCRGPHVSRTGELKAFKLLSSSGAYWRGDEKNPMLQRIYGTAWLTQEELDQYLWRLEEAKKRDHRKLGRELDLFDFYDVAPGRAVLAAQRDDPGPRAGEVRARAAGRAAATRRSRRRCSSTRSCGSSRATGITTRTTCSSSRSRARSSASSR